VGLLDSFEERLDRLVNGAFARAFKSEVQPVEVAAAVQAEMDEAAVIAPDGRTVVPNRFAVDLSAHDFDRLGAYARVLTGELATVIQVHATSQGYALLGPVTVELQRDDELDTGIFRVVPEVAPNAVSVPTGKQEYQESNARLVVNDVAHPLTHDTTVVGRGNDVQLRVDDPGISRRHFVIELEPIPVIRDLGSTNGTLVDDEPIVEAVLQDGSRINIGNTVLIFKVG
jgi:hypothetical protein